MTTSGSHAPLLVVCDYSLRYLGGAQTAFVRQAEALAASGPVILVAPDADALAPTTGLTAVAVRTRFVLPGIGLPILESRRRLRHRVAELVDRFHVAGVVVHSEFALAAAALAVARDRGIPSVHTVHTFFWTAPRALNVLAPVVRVLHRVLTGIPAPPRLPAGSPIAGALRTMTLTVARRADLVISPSAHQARALEAVGLPRVRVLSNVVEAATANVPAEAEAPGAARRVFTVVWAARFAPEKRLEVAVEAVTAAVRRLGSGRIRLEVAGGAGRDRDGVRFHGRVEPARVGGLIDAADAVLITSAGFDNQPMVALEGFARGRPVIVVDPALAAEFGDASLCSSGPDASALADLLVRLVEDPARVRAAARYARDYARVRGPASHARRLRAAVDAAAQSAGATPDDSGVSHPSRRFTGIPLSP